MMTILFDQIWFFFSWFHLYGIYTHTHPFFFPFLVSPLFFHRATFFENVTAAIISYAVSHLHEGTGKLRGTCADKVGYLTDSDFSHSLNNDPPLRVSMCRP